ncbi:hypothetical protein JCM8547_006024 [Rhodosporidiobolus lusitaniae]
MSACLPFVLPAASSDEIQATNQLQLVHSDLLTVNIPSITGRRYIITFINDYSRMLWVETVARKSDALAAFQPRRRTCQVV